MRGPNGEPKTDAEHYWDAQELRALRAQASALRRARVRHLLTLLAVLSCAWFVVPNAYGGPYGEGIYGDVASAGRYVRDKLQVLFAGTGYAPGTQAGGYGYAWTDAVTANPVTFTRASVAFCDNGGVDGGLWLDADVPCIRKTVAADGTAGYAYLSEPASANKILYNVSFDAGWTAASVNLADGGVIAKPVVTWNACTAPDGTLTGTRIDFPAVDDSLAASSVGASTLTSTAFTGTAAAWTESLYVVAVDPLDGGTLRVNTGNTASSVDFAAFDAGSAWQRGTFTPTLTAASYYMVLGPDTTAALGAPKTYPALSVCVWEAQAELGSVATSPVTNAGTALTRAGTIAWVDGGTAGLSLTEGCAAFCVTPGWSGNAPATVRSLTAGDLARLAYTNSGDSLVQAFDGTHTPLVSVTFTAGSKQCFRTHWSASANVFGIDAQDGGLGVPSVFTTFPAFDSAVALGNFVNNLNQTNGYISGVRLGATSEGCR